jgi:hypothetical protein
VLRRLRRRSLLGSAATGRSTPRPSPASARGRGCEGAGIDALLDVVGQLQGATIPASVLETDVATRDEHHPGSDELCQARWWIGAGGIGARRSRCALFRDEA